MTTWTLILIGLCIGWAAMYGLGLGMGFKAGRERGRFDAQIDGYQQAIAARQAPRAPRHAQVSPLIRAGAAPTPPRAAPARTPQVSRPQPIRRVVTAADLAPVFLPRGAAQVPMRPEPGRNSGPGTLTSLPAITATGELAAVTNRYIHEMRAEEAAYRKNLTGSHA